MADDLVRRVALAMCAIPADAQGESCKEVCEICNATSRAAIRLVLEEAAKVASNYPALSHGSLASNPARAADQAASEIAAAILAMMPDGTTPAVKSANEMTIERLQDEINILKSQLEHDAAEINRLRAKLDGV